MSDNEDDDVGEPESASTRVEQRRQFNAGMNEELSKLKGETSRGTQFLRSRWSPVAMLQLIGSR